MGQPECRPRRTPPSAMDQIRDASQGAAMDTPRLTSFHLRALLLAVACFILAGCGDSGALTVTTITGGEVALARSGYTVSVAGVTSRPIGPNESVMFSGLSQGSYEVALDGVSPDCAVDQAVRRVDILAEENAELTFEVICEPVIFFADTVSIPTSCLADLDTGATCTFGPVNDIWLESLTATEHYLDPYQDSRIGKYGTDAPSKSGCLLHGLYTAPYRIPVEELPTGTFLCALTNENRLSEIEIIEEACASRGVLVVSIRTFMFRY